MLIPAGLTDAAVEFGENTIILAAISMPCTGNVPVVELEVAAWEPGVGVGSYFFAPDQRVPAGP